MGGGTGGGTVGGGGGSVGGGSGGGATGGGGGASIDGGALMPNVMLLIDTSGSMSLPINPQAVECPAGCGSSSTNLCPVPCPTRIAQLRSGVGNWLAARGTSVRLGLTTFPEGTLCQLPTSAAVALPAPSATDEGTASVLQQNASQISLALQARTPQGGTPTGPALTLLASTPGLTATDGREDFVVLITDGLPNCNANNTNAACTCNPSLCGASCSAVCAAQTTACQCTTSTCTNALCSLGCLDTDATISAVSTLRTAGVRTIVVGFGADTASGPAITVLDAMARAGGAPRSCPNGTSAECGGLQCLSNRTCEQAFYRAQTSVELQAVLGALF